MSAFWQRDTTMVEEDYYEMTAEEDLPFAFDATPLLVNDGAASDPQSILYRVVQGGADVPVGLDDPPSLGASNVITQQVDGLTPDTLYRLRITFATSGSRRAMTLMIKCVE